MTDTSVPSPAPGKQRRWLRGMIWGLGIVVVLLVVAYFVATSSAFVKGFIMPRVSASLKAQVSVSSASVSPFSQVVLRDLKVQTTGSEPLVVAPEVRLRYSLMKIIGGDILVHEVALVSPTLTLIQNPDGSSNLDPVLKGQEQKSGAPTPAPSGPVRIDIRRITLTSGTIRQLKLYRGGNRDLTELSDLNLEVSGIQNGQTGKMTLASRIRMEDNPPAPGKKGLLEANLKGNLDFGLGADLKPGAINGSARLEVVRAEDGLAQATGLNLSTEIQIAPTEIKQVALILQRGSTRLAQLRVSGPFDMEKTEGRLAVQLLGVDKNLLNLAGTDSGLDFGSTTVNSTNLVTLAKGGQAISTVGQVSINSLQVTRTNQTTPPVDLHASYDVAVDQAASNILVKTFQLAGSQKGSPFLRGELTRPMSISLGGTQNAVGDSTLQLTITRLDLGNWSALLGELAPAGEVNAKLQLLSKQAGKHLEFDLESQVANLTAVAGSNRVAGATVSLRVRGQATELKQFNLPEYRLQVSGRNQPAVTLSGSGVYDRGNETADLRLEGEMVLPRLLQLAPQPEASITSGTAKLVARVLQKQKIQNLTGNMALSDLTGSYGSNYFRSFGAAAEFDIDTTPELVRVRKLNGRLTEGNNAGGRFDATATYNLTNGAAQVSAQLAGFNQAGLRAFLEPMLTDKELVSVAVSGNAEVAYDPAGASTLKADLQMTNLVVRDPRGQFPQQPLEARMQADASLNKQVAEVRQFALSLTPTERATNRLQLTGRVDMRQATNIQGNLKLAAESLDFTRYYDLFAGTGTSPTQQPGAGSPAAATTSAQASTEAEPDPRRLPFTNFVAEAGIGRLFLREMAISNLQTVVKLNGGRVWVEPCKLDLNGAPLSMTVDLDLSEKGYKYAVAAIARAIPLAPVVNSLAPERRGQVGGTLSADAKVTGLGTTGSSLQKHLAGHFEIGSTNLNLSVLHVRSPLLRSVITVVAMIPDLAKNPDAALTTIVGRLLPQPSGGSAGGLAAELEKSPIDQIVLRGAMDGGTVQLQQALVQSPAFRAQATGTIRLEPVLTNSQIQIPVSLALSRPVAEKTNLLPPNTPTNQAYIQLPDFLTMRGTIGEPKRDLNKVALAGTVFQGVRSLIPGGAGQTGNLIQGLLGGGTAGKTNSPATTNRPSGGVDGLLHGLLGGASTNAPASTTTNRPATNQNPLGNILDGLLGPKKK